MGRANELGYVTDLSGTGGSTMRPQTVSANVTRKGATVNGWSAKMRPMAMYALIGISRIISGE